VNDTLADDTDSSVDEVNDTVDETAETANDTVEETAETVNDTVDETAETANDTVDETAETVDDAVADVSDSVDAVAKTDLETRTTLGGTLPTVRDSPSPTDTDGDDGGVESDDGEPSQDEESDATAPGGRSDDDEYATGRDGDRPETGVAGPDDATERWRETSGSEDDVGGSDGDELTAGSDTTGSGDDGVTNRERSIGAVRTPVEGPGGSETAVAGAIALSTVLTLAGAAGTTPTVTGGGGRALLNVVESKWPRFLAVLRYSRYDDSDPFEHDARAALFDEIERAPGTHMSAIAAQANVSLSTARHHLRVLDDEDLVTVEKIRGKRRYFPGHEADPELVTALSEPATNRVLQALSSVGPATTGRVAEAADRDTSTVSHHLDRLAEQGLVERQRQGRAVRNRLAPRVDRALGTGAEARAVADD